MQVPPASSDPPLGVAPAGGGSGGSSGPVKRLLRWVTGHLSWAAYQGLGVVLGLPMAIKLLVQFVSSPRQTLHRKDRAQLQLPDPLPDLTHEWIETEPGIKLHAVRTSKGSGRPLVLLVHGFPEAWFSWKRQMEAFRGEYEVVAIDMRGYNESSKPSGREHYRLERLGADVVAVAQHLLAEAGQKQLVLVGHDWGANVCWAAAYLAPHLFRRLAILAVPHPSCYFSNLDWDQFCRSWYVMAFQVPGLAEAAISANDFQMLADTFTQPPMAPKDPSIFSPEDIERYKQAFGRPGATKAAIDYYRSLIDFNTRSPHRPLARAFKTKLSVPTLLLWGEEDGALGPQLLRGTEKYVDSLRVVRLAGCSHWIQQDQPEQTNRLLREFIQG